ncbi:MAG: extracellular solute-binding protein [Deinococcales bacterium]
MSLTPPQTDYEITPKYAGGYFDASTKLVATLQTPNQPVMFDAEVTVFNYLVSQGAVADLSDLVTELPQDLINDIYPMLWAQGDFEGKRYGLPLSASVPVLIYNATAFSQRGVSEPQTWADFELAAERLTTRQTKGFINVSAAFSFETMVNSIGGKIISDEGQPLFNSSEAIEVLTMLKRLSDKRYSTNHNFAEAEVALVDFVRTKGMMGISSFAFFTQGERFTIAFEPGIASIPLAEGGHVPLMEGELLVLKSASEAQRRGAVAFWQFLMEPERNRAWVEASYFLPSRRATTTLLEGWIAEDAKRGVGIEGLEHATLRPRTGRYAVWQSYLEEALEKCLKGGFDPTEVLNEAQRRAEMNP